MMNLRTKTVDAINTKAEELGIQAEELMKKVEKFIEDFCKMNEDEARKLMIRLKVTPVRPEPEENEAEEGEGTPEAVENTEKKTTFVPTYLEDVLEELGIADIGAENVVKVCGDTAAAYKAAHPDCWLAGDKEEYPEELRKAVGDDITLLSIIYEQCKSASYLGDETVGRIKHLTASPKENYRFGGLREMKFSIGMAQYFKDIANQIGEYFKSFVPEAINRIEIPADFVPSPEPESEPANEPAKYNLPQAEAKAETPQAKEHIDSTPNVEVKPAKLSSYKLLQRKKDVKLFLTFCDKLTANGIDPALVIEKIDKVRALVEAADEI